MTNRREFLHLGMAALSLPIAARAGVSLDAETGACVPPASVEGFAVEDTHPEPLYKVFFDERFAACADFANRIRQHAAAVEAIRGDVTQVWFNDLYHIWRKRSSTQRPAAIAGMTAPGAIFCLEMLARDAGMRVALRVDHRRVGARIEHQFAGPRGVLSRAERLEASGLSWPERMAEIVARFPAERSFTAETRVFEATVHGADGPQHLVTWVIASARRTAA